MADLEREMRELQEPTTVTLTRAQWNVLLAAVQGWEANYRQRLDRPRLHSSTRAMYERSLDALTLAHAECNRQLTRED